MSQVPKSFPRQLLLNVPGTFDDKVREMLAQKPALNTNSARSEAKSQESTTKVVPGIRKTIAKQPLIPSSHLNQNWEHPTQPNNFYKNVNFDESNRASSFNQPSTVNGYYQAPSWNSTPSSYQDNYDKNPPNFQRYQNMGGNQQQQPSGNFNAQPSYPFQNSFSNFHTSEMIPSKFNDFPLKMEETNFYVPEKGPRQIQEFHDTFSNDSTTSTIEPPLARGNSLIQRQLLYNDDRHESHYIERQNNFNSLLSSNLNGSTRSLISVEKSGQEAVSYDETKDNGNFVQDQIYSQQPTKNAFKKAFKLKKSAKLAQKNLNWKEKTSFKSKEDIMLRSSKKIKFELEEGEVDYHFTPESSNTVENVVSKSNIKSISDRKLETAIEEEIVPFLYANKSYYVDPLTFVFPL